MHINGNRLLKIEPRAVSISGLYSCDFFGCVTLLAFSGPGFPSRSQLCPLFSLAVGVHTK